MGRSQINNILKESSQISEDSQTVTFEHEHDWIRITKMTSPPLYHCACGDSYNDRANY